MKVEHVFLYEPKPERLLDMAYLDTWDVVRTEVRGRGYDLDDGEPLVMFTHFIRPKDES